MRIIFQQLVPPHDCDCREGEMWIGTIEGGKRVLGVVGNPRILIGLCPNVLGALQQAIETGKRADVGDCAVTIDEDNHFVIRQKDHPFTYELVMTDEEQREFMRYAAEVMNYSAGA